MGVLPKREVGVSHQPVEQPSLRCPDNANYQMHACQAKNETPIDGDGWKAIKNRKKKRKKNLEWLTGSRDKTFQVQKNHLRLKADLCQHAESTKESIG